ncbi:EAL domain-containing protein [Rummeliibacillus sp. JY-2-4R]
MKKTTLDLMPLRGIEKYYSGFEQNSLFFLIHRLGDQFNIIFTNDYCQKKFGHLHKDVQLAEHYLPTTIWSVLKPMLLNPISDVMMESIDSNKQISVNVGKDEFDSYYFCKIVNHLHDSEFITLFEENLDPILIIDYNSTILNSNQAAKAKFGYMDESTIGKSIYEFTTFFSKDNLRKLVEETLFLKCPAELSDCGMRTIEGKTIVTYIKSVPIIAEQSDGNVLLILRDIIPESEKLINYSYLSYLDQLTGLGNNKALNEHFLEVIQAAKEKKQLVAVLSIDLDRFKKVNETYGSTIGDNIIREASNRLSQITNENTHLYRINGDHFIFIVQDETIKGIQSIAMTAIEKIKKTFIVAELELSITASIGISIYPSEGKKLEELIRKSNQALSYVKERGRSGYRFYQNNMEDQFRNTALIEGHLCNAINKNELMVYYQPQIDLETEKITSFEALLRWQNPKFGFVPPSTFIPIAEDSGLIIEIGDWVLEQACKQLYEWKKQGISNIRVAVNISPKQFREDKFSSKIFRYLKEYDIKPELLELEITESSMTDAEDTMTILKQLKSMGLIISIDDFGTGYSSLSYIKRYPIDIIKIDQSFIRDMDTDEKDRAIAKTIIHLAHSLGLDVIAEGVEKDEHVGFLKDHHCKKAQGFLFSKPLPICELMEKIPMTMLT